MKVMAQESVSPVCLYRFAASGLHLGPLRCFSSRSRLLQPSCLQFLLLFVETFLSLWKQVTEEIQKEKKKKLFHFKQDIPDGSAGKESACNAEDIGGKSLVPVSGRSPEKGNGYPFQYSCLENSTGRGALAAYSPKRRKESDTTKHAKTTQQNTQTHATSNHPVPLLRQRRATENYTCYQLLSTY